MGDYAVFVWSAYGAAALAVGLLTLYCVLDNRAQALALARLEGEAGSRDE